MSAKVLQDFALDASATSALASLQAQLVEEDIQATSSKLDLSLSKDRGKEVGRALVGGFKKLKARERPTVDSSAIRRSADEIRELKQEWFDRWRALVEQGFAGLEGAEVPELWPRTDPRLREATDALRDADDRLPSGLVLLELATFTAYIPFDDDLGRFKGLNLDKTTHNQFLSYASMQLGYPAGQGEHLRKELIATQRSMSKYWQKLGIGLAAGLGLGALTMGLAAIPLAGAIGAQAGLAGAAAINSGLAALGGGAVAAGGLGMTGGLSVLVGGGALLGTGMGGAAGRLAVELSEAETLVASAKLEVVLKELVLQGQKDTAKAQEILFAQRNSIRALEDELDALRTSSDASDERMQQLEKAIKVMGAALERNQAIARETGA